MQKIRC